MISAIVAALALSQAAPCSPSLGVKQLWAAQTTRFVVVGELHGTAEVPAAFAEMVCAASGDRPVNVGLEFEDTVQPDLDRWMSSSGDAAAREAFLSHITWTRRFQDGRSSAAMLDMLERLRQLKAGGHDIAVRAFVPSDRRPPNFDQNYYELAMAQKLSEVAQERPDALNLVLVGRYHAGKADRRAIAFLPPSEVKSLILHNQGGEAWVCPNEDPAPGQPPESVCRAMAFAGADDGSRGVILDPSPDGLFDGRLAVGPVTASAPAVRQ